MKWNEACYWGDGGAIRFFAPDGFIICLTAGPDKPPGVWLWIHGWRRLESGINTSFAKRREDGRGTYSLSDMEDWFPLGPAAEMFAEFDLLKCDELAKPEMLPPAITETKVADPFAEMFRRLKQNW